MARFTKTYLDLETPPRPAIQCDFLGWDELAQGLPCTEAMHATDLNRGMSATDLARFTQLSAGTGKVFAGIEYRRDW